MVALSNEVYATHVWLGVFSNKDQVLLSNYFAFLRDAGHLEGS